MLLRPTMMERALLASANAKAMSRRALDGFEGVHAAYGMRRLRSSWETNKLIRIREDGGDTEKDFGWSSPSGDLDIAGITAFLGGNNGFVVTWYDQSGNARDFGQSTNARQPALTLNSKNGHPTIDFTSANTHRLTRIVSGDAIYGSPEHTINFVLNAPDSQTAGSRIFQEGHSTGDAEYAITAGVSDVSAALVLLTNDADSSQFVDELSSTDILNASTHVITITKDSDIDFVARVDGAQTETAANAATGDFTFDRAAIAVRTNAGSFSSHITMDLCEMIFLSQIMPAPNIAALEGNQMLYWGVS